MYQLALIIHIIAAVCLIVLVLVQQGKGATVGASFGAGASQTIFGSRGAGSFLLKLTLGLVVVFFGTSIALNWMSSHAMKQSQAEETVLPPALLNPGPAKTSSPAVPALTPAAIPAAAAPAALPVSVPAAATTPDMTLVPASAPVTPEVKTAPKAPAPGATTQSSKTKKKLKHNRHQKQIKKKQI